MTDVFAPGFLDHGHVLLGLFQKVFFVAHLIGAAAAAGFAVPGDTEIDSGLLQYLGGGLGQFLHVLIEAGQAADVIDHVHFFFGGIFQIQAGCPIASFSRFTGTMDPCFRRPAITLSRAGLVLPSSTL